MNFSKSELIEIIKANENKIDRDLQRSADKVRREYYGNSVYVRGLIEFTNYCKKRLLLLRDQARKQKCRAVSPEQRGDTEPLRGGRPFRV